MRQKNRAATSARHRVVGVELFTDERLDTVQHGVEQFFKEGCGSYLIHSVP